MKRIFTYLSLFSSGGVGCYGFTQSGFECIATNELLSKRLEVQKHNKKCKYESGYIGGSISDEKTKEAIFNEINRWAKKKHKLDVLIATPPCQGMSVANHKKGDELNRNSLVVESIKLTKELQPKYFIFENVRSFLTAVCTDIDGVNKSIETAISLNLGGHYNILSRIVNLKDYGSHSSRTRTLVIGVRKDIKNITPYDIFPKKRKPKTLRALISDLPSLDTMGEISDKDIYHSYRGFDERMLPWIENLKEGQSAFENEDPMRVPHRIINGEMVYNKSKNGDKYARWYWDRVAPCIHTRNDILASQSTIHPSDNRVFSIRELMRAMSIPHTFKWTGESINKINNSSIEDKKDYLKQNELNIRQCIGEAVPTGVFKSIAQNIKTKEQEQTLNTRELNLLIKDKGLENKSNLINFIEQEFDNYSLSDIFSIAEHSNSKRQHTSAYFTRLDIAYSVIKELPVLKKTKKIKILEPSVGVGAFIPLLISKYNDKEEIIIDACDIDNDSLDVFRVILKKLKAPSNIKINLINDDFLLLKANKKYDIVIGNPPYKKITKQDDLLKTYKKTVFNKDTNNIFSFFIEKSLVLGDCVSLIVPKSLLNAPEFNKTRKVLSQNNITKITDYGEKAFRDVKIETISFLCNAKSTNTFFVESYINNTYKVRDKKYIFSKGLPGWLIYRNKDFDDVLKKLNTNVFTSFRDRQITKKHTKPNGLVRVLKSRNIGNNAIKDIDGYDCYLEETNGFIVTKFLNMDNVVLVPNLTYYPRATFLPKNTIADGSVALLTTKDSETCVTKKI